MEELNDWNYWMQKIKDNFKVESLITHFPYVLLLAFLGIFYIANAHYHLQLERRIDKREKELKKLSWEYLSVKSEVMYQSKQSEVAKKVSILGLKPLSEPPKVIEIHQ